uniref:GIR1-like zinc ribbon domain-containing protein n=1 Tax=Leersia perrieri TaxID=77586 RepID=A0A0D9WBE0_9ORYZ
MAGTVESPASSCVSSDAEEEAPKQMVVAGCPQCLMYVMLSEPEEQQPKCPRCKSPVLLHFLHGGGAGASNNPPSK